MIKLTGLVATTLLAMTVAAQAHIGSGAHDFVSGIAHPFSGIDHLLAMVAVGIFVARLGGKALWLVPSAFITMMMVGGVLGMAGFSLPFVEIAIGVSVITLGLIAALGVTMATWIAMAVVGFFALFHGHSHGTEMPQTASGLEYGLGFVLTTASLHAAGIGIGIAIGKAGQKFRQCVFRAAERAWL